MSTPIRPRERDAIVADILADPAAIQAIADKFHRQPSTIDKMRIRAGIALRRRKATR